MKNTTSLKTTLAIALVLIGAQIVVLHLFGQPPICECGYIKLWEGVVQSSGNSQHISDWYTPSHIIHGILFFALFTWLFPAWSIARRLFASLALEISWELVENTPMVIDHYRKQALAQGYIGDSILNSVSDTLAMVVGFFAAARLPSWFSVVLILALEFFTMYIMSDGLLLNIINLIHPFEFISEWQMSR